jgi:hypothetical protein
MNLTNLTPKQLRKAAKLQEKIEVLQDRLMKFLTGETVETSPVAKAGRRKMSASHKAALRAAQKERWKKFWAQKNA